MALTQQIITHGFLARFATDGSLQGAHIDEVERIVDDAGTVIAEKILAPRGIVSTDASVLAQISGVINAAALADITAKTAQIATLTADKAAADAARDAALAQVAELTAQLSALQPATVDGVPQSITPAQGEIQLKAEGLLGAVLGYIDSLPADDTTRIAYARALTWDRQSPTVLAMMQMLGKDDAAADAFFVAASQIRL